jgi:hypothetical protein
VALSFNNDIYPIPDVSLLSGIVAGFAVLSFILNLRDGHGAFLFKQGRDMSQTCDMGAATRYLLAEMPI